VRIIFFLLISVSASANSTVSRHCTEPIDIYLNNVQYIVRHLSRVGRTVNWQIDMLMNEYRCERVDRDSCVNLSQNDFTRDIQRLQGDFYDVSVLLGDLEIAMQRSNADVALIEIERIRTIRRFLLDRNLISEFERNSYKKMGTLSSIRFSTIDILANLLKTLDYLADTAAPTTLAKRKPQMVKAHQSIMRLVKREGGRLLRAKSLEAPWNISRRIETIGDKLSNTMDHRIYIDDEALVIEKERTRMLYAEIERLTFGNLIAAPSPTKFHQPSM
jgi:hypothetical protein